MVRARHIVSAVLYGGCVLLGGCVQDKPLGPDLGACADAPDGAWTFGEAGIGTCLAGPSDLRFAELDGETWLVVANGDPYQNFRSGSLLMIPWERLDLAGQDRLDMSTVGATSLQITRGGEVFDGERDEDDPAARFFGQVGLVLDRPDGVPLALVPSRFTQDGAEIDAPDLVHVFDLSDPSAPVPWAEGPVVEVGIDPMHVEVMDGRAYVTHLSESYLSVLDVHATPIAPVRLSGSPRVGDGRFVDADDSGSRVTLAATEVVDRSLLLSETWTLSWRAATWRFWAPRPDGLARLDLASGVLREAPDGAVLPGDVTGEPITGAWAALDATGLPTLWLAADGNIFQASTDGFDWTLDTSPRLRGGTPSTPERFDSPSLFTVDAADDPLMAVDATLDGGDSAIAIAGLTADASAYTVLESAALVPPAGISYADPHVLTDPYVRGARMWLSVDDGAGGWTIAESVSGDGLAWSEPTAVEGLPEVVSNPIVGLLNGRYTGWFTAWVDDEWQLVRASSMDGSRWSDVRTFDVFEDEDDRTAPPRAAVLTQALGGFTVEGSDTGRLSGLAVDGAPFTSALATRGFAFEVSTGFSALGTDLDEDLGANGLQPGAALELGGEPHLLVTTTGTDGLRHLSLARVVDGSLEPVALDLVPPSDATPEAHDPVVFGEDGDWTMLFAVPAEEGGSRVLRATSTDALDWTVAETPAFVPDSSFAVDGVLPGSVETLDDGRLRLWFTGVQRDTHRIGAAISEDGGATFTLEPGDGVDWQVGQGDLTTFDDAGVRDPRLFEWEGEPWMAYAGFDGDVWRLGVARLIREDSEPGSLTRRRDLAGDIAPWLPRLPRSFAAGGHDHPVVMEGPDGLDVWFAGRGLQADDPPRAGLAFGTPDRLFPDLTVPTSGDVLTFATVRDGGDEGQIVLDQRLERFQTSTVGLSGLRADPERGFLYVTSDAESYFLVVDVDKAVGREDANLNDLEGAVRFRSDTGSTGLRDVLPIPGEDLLYVTGRRPDAVLVVDGAGVLDDDDKQVHEDLLFQAMPLRTAADDAGADGVAAVGGGIMALRDRPDGRLLLVPHFRDNAVYIYDLDRGAYGEQVAYLPFVGENPHAIRMSPDGRHAVVANFLGEVADGFVSSSLAVIDTDPSSETYLEVVATLVNR